MTLYTVRNLHSGVRDICDMTHTEAGAHCTRMNEFYPNIKFVVEALVVEHPVENYWPNYDEIGLD
jgi:hypothetical protein